MAADVKILRGNIIHTPAFGELETLAGGYLVLEDGVIQGIFPVLPERYAACPVENWGDRLIMPAFADMHLHAPQYPMLGMGMDLPLLDWLNAYAFPTEARFADTGYAREIYRRLARELIENGTTRVCMFSSLHTDATLILMEELEKAAAAGYELSQKTLKDKDFLAKKSMWIFGGDGWAYDIGFGGLDHVLASGEDVNVFVFDTEVYSNTGGQASKASNIGQVAQFAAAGKTQPKKSLAEIAMQYGYVYVAQVAMGANPNQTIKAITEAEAYHGPSLIIGYAPCEMHSIKGGMTNCQSEMKKAVECGYWNLFRFNPALKAEGKNPFTLDSKAPAGGYQEFLMNEARYSSLTRAFPERAKELFAENEEAAKARYEHLTRLVELYK